MYDEEDPSDKLLQNFINRSILFNESSGFLQQFPLSSMKKVSWNKIVKVMPEIIKTYAKLIGLIWAANDVAAIEKNIDGYFDMLEVFLVLSNASLVGAGIALTSRIRTSVTHVIQCSYELMKESVATIGTQGEEEQKRFIQRFVTAVCASCYALEKTPGTNVTAAGRALIHIALCVEYKIHKMKQLKPASSNPTDMASTTEETQPQPCADELSPEELNIAKLSIDVALKILTVIKELMHSITGVHKQDRGGDFVVTLDTLVNFFGDIADQIIKLADCLYHPQNIHAMNAALKVICCYINDIQAEIESIGGNTPFFILACYNLNISLASLEVELVMKL